MDTPQASEPCLSQSTYKFPYYCDPAELPDTLPTLGEIEQATVSLPTIRNPETDRIVLVKDCFVVKYGMWVTENEGNALLLLEKHDLVPTPKLYAMFREGRKTYLIMSLMPGTQLSLIWDDLSEDEKLDILAQLRKMWDYIRSIPSPGIFSGVGGGPLRHRFFYSRDRDPRVTGPFDTEKEICLALALQSKRIWDGSHRYCGMPEYFAQTLPRTLVGHTSVLTHGDLQQKNILVERVSPDDNEGKRRFLVTAVLDWEDAGWYPSYWEYASCFIYFRWHEDWPLKLERIVDPYPLESAMLRVVRQDLEY